MQATSRNTTTLTINDAKGATVAELKGRNEAGLHRLGWNLMQGQRGKGPAIFRPLASGEYTATLQIGERVLRKRVRVQVEGEREPVLNAERRCVSGLGEDHGSDLGL